MTAPTPAPVPPPVVTPPLKPGYQTTELAVVVLVILGQLVAALAGDLSPHWAAIATSVSAGLYALSRGLAKLNPPKGSA